MIETLPSYRSDGKNSQLTGSLFYKDTAGRFDKANPLAADGAVNDGLNNRYKLTKNSNVVDNDKAPYTASSSFKTDTMLNDGMDVKVKLIRSSDAFRLLNESRL